jgi:hypothetical protein
MRVSVFTVVPLIVALAACSGADSEAPVDLKPGQYEIAFAGLNGATTKKDHCILPEEASAFPSDPVSQFLPDGLRHSCQPQGERKGNALNGTLTCKIDGTDTRSELTLSWFGQVHSDSFEVQADGVLKDLNAPEGASPNQSHVTVTGKRTGDCFS